MTNHRTNKQRAKALGWSVDATRRELVRRFPNCFVPKGTDKRPLKIGVHREILKLCPDIPKVAICAALGDYIAGWRYQRALVEQTHRINLRGETVEEIDAGSKTQAAEILARRWPARVAQHLEQPASLAAE